MAAFGLAVGACSSSGTRAPELEGEWTSTGRTCFTSYDDRGHPIDTPVPMPYQAIASVKDDTMHLTLKGAECTVAADYTLSKDDDPARPTTGYHAVYQGGDCVPKDCSLPSFACKDSKSAEIYAVKADDGTVKLDVIVSRLASLDGGWPPRGPEDWSCTVNLAR